MKKIKCFLSVMARQTVRTKTYLHHFRKEIEEIKFVECTLLPSFYLKL